MDLWLPVQAVQSAQYESTEWRDSRYWGWTQAVVRLDDGATLASASEEATALHRGGRQAFIEADVYPSDARIEFEPLVAAARTPEGRVAKWLLGVAFIVLLIACANVANLLLARATRRRRGAAVRLALGVSPGRLVLERGIEAVTLALVGGVVALMLARWAMGGLAGVLLPGVLFSSATNARIVGFTLGASLLAGTLAGVIPALEGTRPGLMDAMADHSGRTSGRGSRLRSTLVVFQTALSVILLVGAGLFVRSLDEVRSLDLGIEVDDVVLAHLEFEPEWLTDIERTELYGRAGEQVQRLRSVSSAAVAYPTFRASASTRIRVPGADTVPAMPGGGPYYYYVGPSYFETLGLEILQGRSFDPSDRRGGRPVAIVSRRMADSLWNGSALGGCIILDRAEDESCITVVGVVEDASRGSIDSDPFFAWYRPIEQAEEGPMGLYVRVDGDREAAAREVALALRTFDPRVRFARAQGLREALDPQARSWSIGATMFTVGTGRGVARRAARRGASLRR